MAKGEVRYRLVLDSSGFQSGLKAAGQAAQQFGNDMAGKLGKAGQVLQAMGPAGMVAAAGIGAATIAITAVTAAVVSAAKAAATYSDNLAALQTKTGLSTDALQKMEVAAKLGNTSIESLASATNKMQRGIVDGNENFKKLGLALSDLKKMTPEEQLKATASAIEKIRDPAQKTAAAVAIFGKSGTDALGALKALADGSADLGGALDSGAIKASAEMADKLDLMGTAMERAWLQFGAAVAGSPEVQQAIEDITDAFVQLATWLQKHSPEIKAFFGVMADGAREAVRMVKDLAGWMYKLSPGLAMLGKVGVGGPIGDSYNQKLRAARQGAGVSSGGVTVSGAPQFRGAADDAAAKKAAADAERASRVWQKAAEDARREWDKFYEDFEKRGREAVRGMEDDIKKRVKAMAPTGNEPDGPIARLQAYNKMQEAMAKDAEKVDEYERGYYERADERLQLKIARVGELADAFYDLGAIVGGVFGDILGGLGQVTQGIGNAAASIRQMKTAGGGFQGMLGKASGALGFAGAAFSIGKVAWGAIKGLFGGKSQEEKDAEAAKIKDTISQLDGLMQKAKAMKMEMLTKSVSGLGNMFGYLANQTGVSSERLERLGRFGSDLLKRLRAEGMSTAEAFKAMGPALDKALDAWAKSGREMSGAFANVLEFRSKVLQNEDLVGAAEGFNDLVGGMPLNTDNIRDVQAELKSLFDDMISKGFTADQALQIMAPSLLHIRDAAREGRIAVDEGTKALIDQAEAAGHFEGLKDPMQELVEVQKMMLELWAAIAQMQGVTLPASLREYINTLHQAQSAQSGLGVPGGGPSTHGRDLEIDFPETPGESGHAASGFHGILGRGPLPGGGTPLVGHPGEEAYLGAPGGNTGITGGMLNLTIVNSVDGQAYGRMNASLTRKNKGGIGSGIQRAAGSR